MIKWKLKSKQWLSLIAVVFLIVSSFPTTLNAEAIENNIMTDELQNLIVDAESINLENKTEDSKDQQLTVSQEAEELIENPEAIQAEIEAEPVKETDTELPEITIENIVDGQKVNDSEITFTVIAEDEDVNVVVLLNDEKVFLNENGTYQVSLIEGENIIKVTATDEVGNEVVEVVNVTYEPIKSTVDIDEAIDQVVNYIVNKGVTGEWEAIGLSRAGIEVPNTYLENFYEHMESQIINQLDSGRIKITDIERLALAALVMKKDPTDINGINLIDLIYNSPTHLSGSDTMTMQGNNGLAFALITLDAGAYKVPEDAKWTRDKIIEEILKGQKENGGWSLHAAFDLTSVDVTAMVMTALAPYGDDQEVKETLQRAVQYLSNEQIESGGFSEQFVGGENSEATAQAIIALTTMGIDPTGKQFTKKNNLVEHLLSFQNEDGGFRHTNDFPVTNSMATEQALLALVAYKLFLENNGPLYQFALDEEDELEEEPVDEEESEIPSNEEDKDHESDQDESIKINIDELLKEKEVTVEVQPGITIVFEKKASTSESKLELPETLPEGTKLIVTKPNDEELPKTEENLEVAGDWFDITLRYPEGNTYEDGGFVLTLAVDPNVDLDDANIYHYNSEKETWELVEAQNKDSATHTITVTVDHFSIYAVLAEAVELEHDDSSEEDEEHDITDDPSNDDEESSLSNKEKELTNNQSSNNDTDVEGNKLTTELKGETNYDNESTTEAKEDTNNKLPSTATNVYNILLFGLVLLIVGSSFYMYHKRKVVK